MDTLLEDIVPRRQTIRNGTINKDSKEPDISFDYLTLYDQAGNVVLRSKPGWTYDRFQLEYKGLIFVSPPGYTSEVMITWSSLISIIKDQSPIKEDERITYTKE